MVPIPPFTDTSIIMTGEPTQTISKESMVPELMFSSECVPQVLFTDLEGEVAITLRYQLC